MKLDQTTIKRLHYLNINVEEKSDMIDSKNVEELASELIKCKTEEYSLASTQQFLEKINVEHPVSKRLFARNLIERLMEPNQFTKYSVNNSSELELTGTYFSSFTDIAGLFDCEHDA